MVARPGRKLVVFLTVPAGHSGICRSVQRGLRSRAYDTGRLSVRREAGEQLFHRLLYADLKAGAERA